MSQTILCEVPAGRIAYSRQGSGRPVALLHPIGVDRGGGDEDVQDWQQTCDIVTIDLRGHGESSLVTAPVTLSDHAADVASVLRKEGMAAARTLSAELG